MKKMSNYIISDVVDDRVLNYRFSVDSKKDPEFLKLKASVKLHNEQQKLRESAGLEPHYLRVRGRGRNPKVSGPMNHQSVRDDNASYFDVYVQRDTDAMARYRNRAAATKVKGFVTKSVDQVKALLAPVRQSA